ncbi:MAG: hypothetical protein HHJ10_13370 [Cellulomonas sp.]|uniref:hypothetical protein n=1 Tax=Cellulomonas sp. TaxID=40001 RepID=UPI0017C45E98|nr:hypothetical protein [Cellulomonas sp.]NMM31990.1 hypothetical protein [Cellulomonas sp.]
MGTAGAVIVVVALLGASWWLTHGTPGLPGEVTSTLERGPAGGFGAPAPAVPPPSAHVVALADAAHFSQEGRRLFYAAQPQILGATAFAGRCASAPAAQVLAAGGAAGCYLAGPDRIVVYEPADPRLRGQAVQTAAHETLHAAWEQLPAADRTRLIPLLEAQVAGLAPTDPLREQLAGSIGSHPENRPTEMFAYLGTQIWRAGGLGPELEQVYARFIIDRQALVAMYTAQVVQLETMSATISAAYQAAAAVGATNARNRAQLDADFASVAYYRHAYDTKAAQVATMTAADRAGLRLSWQWWDGTDLPMAPAKQTLAAAAALLVRDEATLPQRQATVQAAEDAATTERARIQGLVTDLQTLQTQRDPVTAAAH